MSGAFVNSIPTLSVVRPAIIDTGTTLLIIPTEDAEELHKQIPGSEFDSQDNVYLIPCNTTAVVSLVFGGVGYKIPPRDLTFAPISDTQCVSAIIPGDIFPPLPIWLCGQTFLKNVYSVFDVGNKQVGFAQNK
ncbi:42020_t:CDS:1 [Gigaspora margarita]|uniref:42020_t:CDS:1 n=1 Tax=Gigaspora margarita TaxID=4874 RepID=A0ABN7VLD5_GIGMA|nr:42020_t:CDS:1 [Gigaspora margarita]